MAYSFHCRIYNVYSGRRRLYMWCVSKHTFVRPCRSFVHFILNWPIVNFCGQFCWVLKNFTDFRLQSRDDWYWLAMAAGLRDVQKYIKLIVLSTRRYNCVEALLPPWSRRRLYVLDLTILFQFAWIWSACCDSHLRWMSVFSLSFSAWSIYPIEFRCIWMMKVQCVAWFCFIG